MKFTRLFLLLISTIILSCNGQNKEKKSIKDAIVSHSYDDIDVAIMYYKKLKLEDLDSYNFSDENELNNLGYQLLNDNRVEDAIKIFKLLVSEFPQSANAYDSLGEAYRKNGDIKLALENYRKSLELNPKNRNAESVILSIENENRDKDKFYKVYTRKEYVADLEELADNLTTVNPHPFKFMAKEDFWKVVDAKKRFISDSTTYGEFIWHCSEIVANINCFHSSLGYFNQEREMLPTELRFPLETRFIGNKLYVTKHLSNSHIKEGSEILTINGRKVVDLQAEIYKHISTQGHIETSKEYFYPGYGTAYIAYALGFPTKYEIRLEGIKHPIKLKQLGKYEPLKRVYATNLCKSRDLCLDFINDETAVLTIINSGAYYGNRFTIYKDFIDESFQEIRNRGIKNLIVDMRSNGGGPGNTGIYLLQHLAKQPFIYKSVSEGSNVAGQSFEPFENGFKGNTYFLIDGEGGSTTGHILALVKKLNMATIIGEELGGNHFCTGGQRVFKLSNTEVFYYIGRFTNISSANEFPDNRGIMPDHFVEKSIQDYLNDNDPVLKYTLELIQDK
ncbi:Tetratricopeptide repeat-containing protein [Marivirga sericea]|uniref:Tetratricopeptide repeat-containing protein n=1 Tax=Marivirga sericea TaxID=1028 RepID=A0A1X7K5C9_9BACT|nr:S41 family peptidase [Marivirga sericea]SMG35817.1 Tetratricopeptide repeat-containing protein [Marivirga sericea]